MPVAEISLPTRSITVGPEAGAANAAVVNTTIGNQVSWTASTTTTWIHLTDVSGTTEAIGSVPRFTYDANPGTKRSGEISYQSTAFTGTLTVTQAGVGYVATAPPLTPVPSTPYTAAADIAGNTYYADCSSNTLREWAATTGAISNVQFPGACGLGTIDENKNVFLVGTVSNVNSAYEWIFGATQETLLTNFPQSFLSSPVQGFASDLHGNTYAWANQQGSSQSDTAVYNLTHPNAGGSAALIIPSFAANGLAIDASGDIYAVGLSPDLYQWVIVKGNPVSGQVSTLATGIVLPGSFPGFEGGLAVDSSGNLYFGFYYYGFCRVCDDQSGSVFAEWSPITGEIEGLVASAVASQVLGDGLGNIYLSLQGANVKFTPVFVDTTNVSEPAAAGSDQLPPVLPSTTTLNAVSDSAWLTITGQTNGVVSFSFSGATAARTAHITVLSQTITVSQDAPAPALEAHTFVPIRPCRVVDTRAVGAELSADSARDFVMTGGPCGIPSNAQAYALNVTAIPEGKLGFLTAWPQGMERPMVSTLNSDGRTKAVAAIVAAGANGGVSVYASDSTQVALDVTGYFVPAGSTAAGLAYYPVTPCRVADMRGDNGSHLRGGQSRAIPVQASACQVPGSAQAYVLNLTALPHQVGNAALSYLTAWPTGKAIPPIPSLTASAGSMTANAAIVEAGVGGSINVYAKQDMDLTADVSGYFAPPGEGGLALYTMTPCRMLDTRSSVMSARLTGLRHVNALANSCSVPGSARALVLNATVVAAQAPGSLTLWEDREAQPEVSTLRADQGVTTSNMTIVPMKHAAFNAHASEPTHLILDVSSYFAP
jgi:hypothetical protein